MLDFSLADWTNIATIVLAAAAIVAGTLAYRNLGVLKEQRRIDTLLTLIDQMSSQRERDNRSLVHGLWDNLTGVPGLMEEPRIGERIAKLIDYTRQPDLQFSDNSFTQSIIRHREAVEETISCLDKMGFFLLGHPPKLKVDPKLKDNAPTWIWYITLDMWNELGDYVRGIQEGSLKRDLSKKAKANPDYGRYFKALRDEAIKKSPP